MLRRCRSLLSDETAAEDVLQEAFVNLMRYGGGFRTADKKLPYLLQVCNRACYAELDRRRRQPLSVAAPPETISPGAGGDERSAVTGILGLLSPKDRDLAVMVWVEERSQGEAAQALAWSRQTVNKRLQAIRARLRQACEEEKTDDVA